MNNQTSSVGDLTRLAKNIEALFQAKFGGKPGLAIAFTLPPNYNEVHWVTNVSREDGITLFMDTAQKMIEQMGGQ